MNNANHPGKMDGRQLASLFAAMMEEDVISLGDAYVALTEVEGEPVLLALALVAGAKHIHDVSVHIPKKIHEALKLSGSGEANSPVDPFEAYIEELIDDEDMLDGEPGVERAIHLSGTVTTSTEVRRLIASLEQVALTFEEFERGDS